MVNSRRAAEPIHIHLTLDESASATEPMHIDLTHGGPASPTGANNSGRHAYLATKAATKKQRRALKRWGFIATQPQASTTFSLSGMGLEPQEKRDVYAHGAALNRLAPNATRTNDAWSLAEGSEGEAALRCLLLCKMGHTADCRLRTIIATSSAAPQTSGVSEHQETTPVRRSTSPTIPVMSARAMRALGRQAGTNSVAIARAALQRGATLAQWGQDYSFGESVDAQLRQRTFATSSTPAPPAPPSTWVAATPPPFDRSHPDCFPMPYPTGACKVIEPASSTPQIRIPCG